MSLSVTGKTEEATAQVICGPTSGASTLGFCKLKLLMEESCSHFSHCTSPTFQLLETAAPLPTPCNPSDVSHGYVPIKVSKHSLSQLSTLYPGHLKSLTETFVKYQRYLNVYYL